MMLVIGNNVTETIAKQSILSIQLSLNGLSFCVANKDGVLTLQRQALPPAADLLSYIRTVKPLSYRYAQTNVILDTRQVCLIPDEFGPQEGVWPAKTGSTCALSSEPKVVTESGVPAETTGATPDEFPTAVKVAFSETSNTAEIHTDTPNETIENKIAANVEVENETTSVIKGLIAGITNFYSHTNKWTANDKTRKEEATEAEERNADAANLYSHTNEWAANDKTRKEAAAGAEGSNACTANLYLQTNGIAPAHGDVIIAARHKETCAIMCLSGAIHTYFASRSDQPVHYLHPQQINLSKRHLQKTVLLNLGAELVHCTVFDPEPAYSETLPYRTPADILFYLQQLGETYSLSQYRIIVAGYATERMCKSIKKHFKNTSVVEIPPLSRKIKANNLFEYYNLFQFGSPG